MALTRRQLVSRLGALAAVTGSGLWSGIAQAGRIIPWRNWSGAQSCIPTERLAPNSEAELCELMKSTQGMAIRPVGSGHSFTALVPTEGKIVTLNQLTGMVSHDPQTQQAEFYAGTPMSQMGEPLLKAGLALTSMADIDYQTLAGAISTSTHGTGLQFGSLSTQVVGLRLITAQGEMLDLDADHQPEIFNAARVSLGALGVITRVRVQARKAFRLRQKQWVQRTEDILEDLPRLMNEHDHFEFIPLLHADVSMAQAQSETSDQTTIQKEEGGDGDKLALLATANSYLRNHPKTHARLINFMAARLDFPDVIDESFRVYANVRDQRFNEMEYQVPAEAGPACLREILNKIRNENLDVYFPLEFRYVKGDNIPLSMFYGEDRCSISIHQSYDLDYHAYFAQIEPIFWKYGGRPHWGKLHTLTATQLAPLYPRWDDFQDIRRELDPQGKMLNAHLRAIFGAAAAC